MITLERTVTGATPSQLEINLVEIAVRSAGSQRGRTLGSLGWLSPLRLATAAVGMIVVTSAVVLWTSTDTDAWQERSQPPTPFVLRVFCRLADVNNVPFVRSLSRDPGPNEVSTCPPDGTLLFATMGAKDGYVHGVVRNQDERAQLLTPAPVHVPASHTLKNLSLHLPIARISHGAEVVIVVVWSSEPLDPVLVTQLADAHIEDELSAAEDDIVIRTLIVPIGPAVKP